MVGLMGFFISAHFTFGETKVFVEEYAFKSSEADSNLSSRVNALEKVKRLLLEKLGTYLESETEVINFHLSKDQIIILIAGIVIPEIIDEKWDGKTYSLEAKITADPKDVAKAINKLRQDRQKTKELEEGRKKADKALGEVERLKKELTTPKAEKLNLGEYNEAINRLSATDWVDKGYALVTSGKNQEAAEAFTRAIELDPKDAKIYYNRGGVYGRLEDYRRAIREYDKAIELNPKDERAYLNRGFAFAELGDHQQAMEDYKTAARFESRTAQHYLSSKGISW